MSNSILDFIGELQVFPDADWLKLTDSAKRLFVEKSHWKCSTTTEPSNAGETLLK